MDLEELPPPLYSHTPLIHTHTLTCTDTDVTAVKQQLDSLVLVYLHEFCLSIEGQVSAMRTEMLSLMEIVSRKNCDTERVYQNDSHFSVF